MGLFDAESLTGAWTGKQYATKLPAVGALSYDGNGNVLTDTDGMSYTYNGDGTVNTISDGVSTRTLGYNPDGTIASVT